MNAQMHLPLFYVRQKLAASRRAGGSISAPSTTSRTRAASRSATSRRRGASVLRSTFRLAGPGYEGVGRVAAALAVGLAALMSR